MGETGCGKTYLIKYIVNVIYKEYAVYKEFIFHYGVEEKTFIKFMMHLIAEARVEIERANAYAKNDKKNEKEIKPKIFWVFFDEFNTSHLQGFVSEIMNDRVFSLVQDPNCKTYFFPK